LFIETDFKNVVLTNNRTSTLFELLRKTLNMSYRSPEHGAVTFNCHPLNIDIKHTIQGRTVWHCSPDARSPTSQPGDVLYPGNVEEMVTQPVSCLWNIDTDEVASWVECAWDRPRQCQTHYRYNDVQTYCDYYDDNRSQHTSHMAVHICRIQNNTMRSV